MIEVVAVRDTVLDHVIDQFEALVASPSVRVHRIEAEALASYEKISTTDLLIATVRSPITSVLLDRAARLRGVCFPTIGVEAIDVEDASRRGILIGHGATQENTISMAEANVLLTLSLAFRFLKTEKMLREGTPREDHVAYSLKGKTIGLLGFGRIAQETARRLLPFEATLQCFSRSCLSTEWDELVEQVSLDTLLRRSDFLLVLTTLSQETRKMIGAAELAKMKAKAFLINTARGGIVDECALVKALQAGRLAGAALDTFEVEPLPENSPLRHLENVVLTPHIIGHTVESLNSLLPTLVENTRRMLSGHPPLRCKNPQAIPIWADRLASIEQKNRISLS